MRPARVAVTIVTHNSERYIERCLRTVFEQEYGPLEVVVVDNASHDATRALLVPFRHRVRLLENRTNTGFASAQNQAIQLTRADWVLVLNPDVFLTPGFVTRLVEAAMSDPEVGTVCGKLLRIEPDLSTPVEPRIDSAGLYFLPNMRHFDRGCQEPDDGRYHQTEYVFGASAAAALYRRRMIDQIALNDGFFDPDFFAYREDADVAWRAQLLGWRCLYTPGASAWHVRTVRPGPRTHVPAMLNMHSVKNRFLLRVKNITPNLFRRHWPSMLARDLVVLGGCLFSEPSSLPAFWHLMRLLPRALSKRRQIMEHRSISDVELASWFSSAPAAQPAPALAAAARLNS